jgi:hypothetical protein
MATLTRTHTSSFLFFSGVHIKKYELRHYQLSFETKKFLGRTFGHQKRPNKVKNGVYSWFFTLTTSYITFQHASVRNRLTIIETGLLNNSRHNFCFFIQIVETWLPSFAE